ncbi:2-oxo acid dehydrogenase subunit E2 [Pseudofrankia saprophytica]|nr:2-oxo acid dehydrogenase subunit E2 [Pseudofrankia saprophytica]
MALAMERSAFTVPQATVHRAVDVTAMLALVARWRAQNEAAARPGAAAPPRVTSLAFIARAVVAALAAHPLANARWLTSVDGSSEIEVFAGVNLGVAVAADRGLIVPVVPDADRLSLPALAGELTELVTQARAGRTPPARMLGATITVSNVGVFGVDAAAGLVREGEAALVVLGAIRETPAVWEGQIQIRRVMTISVSFDHRILDGEAASRYLGEIAAVLADPTRLLLLG